MNDYISREALYKQTAEWEAQAFHMVEATMNDKDLTEWKKWSTILNERSAFKFDVADFPAADVVERKKGKWIPTCRGQIGFYCFICGEKEMNLRNYCPNCGADMREVK